MIDYKVVKALKEKITKDLARYGVYADRGYEGWDELRDKLVEDSIKILIEGVTE